MDVRVNLISYKFGYLIAAILITGITKTFDHTYIQYRPDNIDYENLNYFRNYSQLQSA